ncbi:MAG: SGNH/GDSL hydrolase family protein [Lentisphaeria bacterium]|nr:SGNH/GDSL hydrolase family protein [Lentisphaeria bacterium]
MKNLKIALFGSSIMEGILGVEHVEDRYYSILHKLLSNRYPGICFAFFNGARGGWSTRELMANLEEFVLQYSPDYCLVMFGANNNDLARPSRILAEGELESLMEEFQKKMPEKCQKVGVVLNPVISEKHAVCHLPVWQETLRQHKGGLDEILEVEREKVRLFFRKYGYPIVDLGKLMRENMENLICNDGIHLTAEGHRFFAENLFRVLEKLPGLE